MRFVVLSLPIALVGARQPLIIAHHFEDRKVASTSAAGAAGRGMCPSRRSLRDVR